MKNFTGWEKVFSFTYRQNTKSKSYRAVTALIAVLLFGLAAVVSVLAAEPEAGAENDPDYGNVKNPIGAVYVLDLAGTATEDWGGLLTEEEKEQYSGIRFYEVKNMTEKELGEKVANDGLATIGIVIAESDSCVEVKALVPRSSIADQADGREIAELLARHVERLRLENSGFSESVTEQILKETVLSVAEAGEETNVLVYLIRYLAPAVFGLVLYFLLLFYGQNINREVSTEKTSKLMETLLTSLHPYGLLTGKVFAVAAVALLQLFLWILALLLGVTAGSVIAAWLYPETESGAVAVLEFVRMNIGETAFSPAAVLLALVVFVCGFLFYCVLSATAGSMVSRPEDAANTQSIFVLPIVISWIVCYIGTLTENEPLLVTVRNIPFTIPFCVPADLLTGAVGIGQGLLSAAILIVFSILVIMLAGRIYKGMVLYTGQKINVRTLVYILKNKD